MRLEKKNNCENNFGAFKKINKNKNLSLPVLQVHAIHRYQEKQREVLPYANCDL